MKQKGKIFKRCLSIVLCMTMLLFSGNGMSVYAQETESNARMEGETVTENVETVPEVENNDEDFISATTFSEGGYCVPLHLRRQGMLLLRCPMQVARRCRIL